MTILPEFYFSISLLVFLLFVFFILVQLMYLFFIYMRFAIYNKKMETVNNDFTPSVSIIIAARNESDNLFQNLPMILSQDYPNFEVIVVNHQSIDESYNVLNALKLTHKNLKIIEVERSKHLGNG
ncbi:MAG: glycosyltransferase, partial [Crocinitomicaceae bacterium]|nr:glycosyltransferase [Crocinitomicaceae bacterium]